MAKGPLVDRRKFLAGSAGAMSAAFFGGGPLEVIDGLEPYYTTELSTP